MAHRWILQFCHSHYGPFTDVARQYAALFQGTDFKVLTVYLTGESSESVREGSASDEVIFLNIQPRQIRGLKLKAIGAFRKIVAERDFALVIAHRFKPIFIACCGSKLPVLGIHHGFGDYRRPMRQHFARMFRQRLGLIGVSNAVRDEIRACLPSWPDSRIETLYNRLDVEAVRASFVSREAARKHLGLPEHGIVIGNVGRLHPDKDQATLIEGFAQALPHLPANSLLAIVGTGPLEHRLRQQAARLGITDAVRFVGQIADARRYFTAFDLFVLSSDHEPFGMVLLEAMAAGVPVMATDCGGAPEVIGNSDMLFGLRDSDSLSQKLTAHFGNALPSVADLYRKEGQQRLERMFSDASAREVFFGLSMTRPLLDSAVMCRQATQASR